MADNTSLQKNGEGLGAVSRVSRLPVVDTTIKAASHVYSKVKDSNSVVTSVFNTAECAVNTAKVAVQPIAARFEGPINTVDSLVCSGLDYVENRVPQIKLPPQELYESAKNTVYSRVEPAVRCVCECAQKVAGLTGFGKICEAGELCIYSLKKSSNAEVKEIQEKEEQEEEEIDQEKKKKPAHKRKAQRENPAKDD